MVATRLMRPGNTGSTSNAHPIMTENSGVHVVVGGRGKRKREGEGRERERETRKWAKQRGKDGRKEEGGQREGRGRKGTCKGMCPIHNGFTPQSPSAVTERQQIDISAVSPTRPTWNNPPCYFTGTLGAVGL